ncbi:hypothetical protein [Nostoc sp.]|uniref:hypothetical protein n=1 Tax=Nostoc sp. TaxID=1180 RepID=UPI003FA5A02B
MLNQTNANMPNNYIKNLSGYIYAPTKIILVNLPDSGKLMEMSELILGNMAAKNSTFVRRLFEDKSSEKNDFLEDIPKDDLQV